MAKHELFDFLIQNNGINYCFTLSKFVLHLFAPLAPLAPISGPGPGPQRNILLS